MKKVLAIMLVCFMLVSLLPMGALAEEVKYECPGKGEDHYLSNCDSEYVRPVDGGCEGYSYDVYKCLGCGDHFAVNLVKNEGEHEWDITDATCEADGKKVCDLCGKTEILPKLPHTEGEREGDCETGYTTNCTVCGEELSKLPGEHNFGGKPSKIEKEPTLTEDGLAIYTCTLCGYEKEVVILSHECEDNLLDVEELPASCLDDGYTAHKKCAICEATFGKEVLPAHGHGAPEMIQNKDIFAFGNWSADPDNLDDNQYWVAANDCEIAITLEEYNWYTVYVYLNGNYYTWMWEQGEVVSIAVSAGDTIRLNCSRGQAKVSISYEVEELVVAGDCFTEGSRTWQCSLCHDQITENTGFNHDYELVHKSEPTCTELGWEIWACKNPECGKHDADSTQPTGHSPRPTELTPDKEWDCVGYDDEWNEVYDWVVVRENPVAPTCKNDGYAFWYCDHEYYDKELEQMVKCGEEQRDPIPALGCEFETVTVDATCSEYGYTYTYCTKGYDCDNRSDYYNGRYITQKISEEETYSIRLPQYIYAIASMEIFIEAGKDDSKHNPGDEFPEVVKEATCTENGLILYWCYDCEQDIVDDTTLVATGHEWTEWETVAPSCGEAGYDWRICLNCGEMEVDNEVTFDSEYVYLDLETAQAAHNIEGLVGEDYKSAVCGGSYGLYRYQCQTCEQYILVKYTLEHVAPEILWDKEALENPAPEAPVASELFSGSDEQSFEFAIPANGDMKFTLVSVDDIPATENDYVVMYVYVDGEQIWIGWLETPRYMTGAPTVTIEDVPAGNITVKINRGNHSYKVSMEYTGDALAHEYCERKATCTEAGWTEQYYCTREGCGALIESTPIEATGHQMTTATCTELATCTVCGVTEGDYAHKWTAATCLTAKTCELCGLTDGEALGHSHVMTDNLLPEDRKETDSYTYKHFECERCGAVEAEYIIDYVAYCKHNWIVDRANMKNHLATCEKEGYTPYICKDCGVAKPVEEKDIIAKKDHLNEAGQDLTKCHPSITDFKCVNGCGETFAEVKHDENNLNYKETYYEANCISGAYIACNCAACGYYKIINVTDVPDPDAHVLTDWMPVEGDNKVIIARYKACKNCLKVIEYEDISTASFFATIENANNPEDAIIDGSLVKVTISVNSNVALWGFALDLSFSEELKYVEYKVATDKFNKVIRVSEDGTKIAAQAAGDVELIAAEAVVELYFTVNAQKKTDLFVNFESALALNLAGTELASYTFTEPVTTVALMDLDNDGDVTMIDINRAYNDMLDEEYNIAVDLNGNGIIDMEDLNTMYDYMVEDLSYEEVLAKLHA